MQIGSHAASAAVGIATVLLVWFGSGLVDFQSKKELFSSKIEKLEADVATLMPLKELSAKMEERTNGIKETLTSVKNSAAAARVGSVIDLKETPRLAILTSRPIPTNDDPRRFRTRVSIIDGETGSVQNLDFDLSSPEDPTFMAAMIGAASIENRCIDFTQARTMAAELDMPSPPAWIWDRCSFLVDPKPGASVAQVISNLFKISSHQVSLLTKEDGPIESWAELMTRLDDARLFHPNFGPGSGAHPVSPLNTEETYRVPGPS